MDGWCEGENTTSSSLSSSTSSSYSSSSSSSSSSCCCSDSEGEVSHLLPGRLGLGEEGVVSFQLQEEDYPEEVLRPREVPEEDSEVEVEEAMDCGGPESPLPSPPSPLPSSSPILYTTSLRLSPLLKARRSSLPHV